MPAEKNCSECNIQVNTLYRIRHLKQHFAKKEWVFACRKCLLKVKRNNIHYKYENLKAEYKTFLAFVIFAY